MVAAPAPDGYEATEPDAGRFRARQLQAVLRLTPAAKVINIANVRVVCGVSWSAGSHAYLLLWTLAVSGVVCMGLSGWLRDRRHSARDWAPRRTLRRAALWDGLAGPAVGAAAWPDALRVSVNVWATQWAAGDLVTQVRSALAAAQLPAQRLELEITESTLFADADAAIDTLRAMGCRTAMDDFGTGCPALG